MKLSTRLSIIFPLILFISFLFAGYLGYRSQREAMIKKTTEQLTSIADIQEKRVNEIVDRYLEQVKLITSRILLKTSIVEYEKTKDPAQIEKITSSINDAKKLVTSIESVSVISQEGRVIASTDAKEISGDRTDKEFFLLGKNSTQLYEVFKNQQNLVKVRLIGPFIYEGKTVGVAEIVTSAAPILAISQDYAGMGISGEILLAKKNKSKDVLFLTPLRFDAGAALSRGIPKNRDDIPSTHAVNGEEKVLITENIVDYRNVPSLAVTRFIDSVGWGLVVKIDRSEALAPVNALARTFSVIALLSIFLVTSVSFFVARSITAPIVKLSKAAERLSHSDFTTTTTTTTIDVNSKDEVGMLADAFRNMTLKLKESYETLEDKVKEKTRDLEIFHQMVGSATDGFMMTTANSSIIYVNRAWENLTGYGKVEVIGKNPRFLQSGKTPEEEISQMRKTISEGRVFKSEKIINKRKDGSEYSAQIQIYPIRESEKNIFYVEIQQDISRRLEIEKQKDEFLNIASHELRTPMSAIKGYVSMIFERDFGQVSESFLKPLSVIGKSTDRLIHLVNNLLNISRIEMQRLKYVLVNIKLKEVVDEVLTSLDPIARNKHIQLISEVSNTIEIQCDADQLKQILNNLIGNSLKFTDTGSIKIGCGEDRDLIIIKVQDTGIGIASVDQNKLFRKFQQIISQQIGRPEGSGLGLYLSRALARNLGGDLWLENSVDAHGTTFAFSLPKTGSLLAAKIKEKIDQDTLQYPDKKSLT